jgi:UDP-GlcNAc:undecaprenyl-phosphate/decaprenyl-phosphate GlcNAc-1-phosphate transferase
MTTVLGGSLAAVIQPALIGLLLALILLPVCRAIALRTGVVAHPRNDRWHRQTVPLLGGAGIAVPVIAGAFITGIATELIVPLAAAFAVFVVGLVDDVIALKPATKLIAQIALASLLVYFGFRLSWVESRLLNSVLTIVWVVGLTNAFNLLDNMDGLCGGIAFVVAAMLLAGLLTGATRDEAGAQLVLLALLLGATGAFLVFNFPPASVFMGDSGALFLGFMLASLTLSPEGIRGSRTDLAAVIAGPVFVLLIPIFDTALVTASRLLSGRSPAVGGRDHSSHRLVALGLSERGAVIVLWSLAAVGGIVALLLRSATEGMSLLLAALFLALMSLFAVFLARVHVYEDGPPPGTITPLVADFMFKRRVVEVVVDFCAIGIAYYAAYRLRFMDPGRYLANVESFYESLPMVLAAQLVAFFVVGVYRGTWHYFNMRDSLTLFKGVVLGTAGAQIVLLYLYDVPTHSRGVFVIYLAIVLTLTTLARASFRGVVALARHERLVRRVVIYGAGEYAAVAVQELHQHRGPRVKVLGFVDDDPDAARDRVEGFAILGGFETLMKIIASGGADMVILNREHIDDERLATIEALCEEHDVSLLRLHVGIEELVTHQGASPAARLRAQLRKGRR